MQITEAFKDKTLVITGGTGSFGSTVLKHFFTTDIGEMIFPAEIHRHSGEAETAIPGGWKPEFR